MCFVNPIYNQGKTSGFGWDELELDQLAETTDTDAPTACPDTQQPAETTQPPAH